MFLFYYHNCIYLTQLKDALADNSLIDKLENFWEFSHSFSNFENFREWEKRLEISNDQGENEGNIRKSDEGNPQKFSTFEARMRATFSRILSTLSKISKYLKTPWYRLTLFKHWIFLGFLQMQNQNLNHPLFSTGLLQPHLLNERHFCWFLSRFCEE